MSQSGEHHTHRPLSVWQVMFYWSTRAILWVCAVVVFRLWITGLWSFPKSGGVLVVANHPSYLDPPMIGISIPRQTRIMAKIELFQGKSPVGRAFAKIITWLGAFAVARNDPQAAFEYAVGLLSEGATMLMFAEGKRSETPQMNQIKSGPIRAAIFSGCWIVPTAVIGTHRAMPKGQKLPLPVNIRVVFGTPYRIDHRAKLGETIHREVLQREVRDLAWKMRSMLPVKLQPSVEQMRLWYG